MALPKEPVVKKFFTNKIESTRDDWYGYLVQIARIFYTLDGEEYNRDILMNKFATMSGRDATRAQRDSSNFRDEFGAYGTYLGVYHLEQRDGKWYVFVSDAAKKFLCCQNPNAAAFCRSQLSLFQYPNGAGAGISANGGQSVQGNIKADTLREIQNGIRLNPLRLICKIVVGEIEIKKKKFSDIAIPYSSIFCMVNDSRINQNYNPPVELVSSVFSEYCATGDNVEMNLEGLTNYKRNFHILEKTGLFTRDSKFGLLLAQRNYAAAYECIKVIADMDVFFDGFENLYDAPDEDGVRDVISSPKWGQYYDAARIPSEILTALGVEEEDAPIKSFLSTADFSYSPSSPEQSNLEMSFKNWLAVQTKANGELYSENTRSQYISALKAVSTQFADAIAPFTSVFEIANADPLEKAVAAIKSDVTYEEFNRSRGNGSLSAGLDLYNRFLLERKAEPTRDICYSTGYHSKFSRNRILFGAPGTGKSFTLNHEKDLLLADGGEYERVTFHPDYSYANFVGTYKPVPCKDSDGKDAITYSYVPGPFMRTYVKALQNSRTDAPNPFLLVIEEINRANVAAVFGDVFQLLDRGNDEVSEYPIQASEDIKKYLAGELGGNPDDYAEIRIPDNMFIWATMNSADQGVFPMDTAFKRRWDFTYLGIDDSEAGIVGKKVILGQGDYRRIVEWNALRKAINNELLTYKVNEDKLMGPYFISKKNLPEDEMIDPAVFARIFKNKVIMYLFDDAAKQKRITLFGGCDEKAKNQYSKICREFDTKGVYIFCEGISSQFIDNAPEDDGE